MPFIANIAPSPASLGGAGLKDPAILDIICRSMAIDSSADRTSQHAINADEETLATAVRFKLAMNSSVSIEDLQRLGSARLKELTAKVPSLESLVGNCVDTSGRQSASSAVNKQKLDLGEFEGYSINEVAKSALGS